MPISANNLSSDRKNFNGVLTTQEIEHLKNDSKLRVLQTCEPVDAETWRLLNDNLFTYRDDIDLRLYYGFKANYFDLSFLKHMKNLKHFSADCLLTAKGIENISHLENLESLSIGIYDLESFDFLSDLRCDQIQKLFIGSTKSKKPTLNFLCNFKNLKTLYIEGQNKDIEVLRSLAKLEDLTLRSITTNDLNFIKPLENLRSLDIKLGGRPNLVGLENLKNIKYLELWQIRGLSDIGVISSLTGLQYLFLQSLPNIKDMPDLSNLYSLRRVYLENMKGLRSFKPFASAPCLNEFIHTMANSFEPIQYLDILNIPTIKKAGVWFGSDKKNKAFTSLAREHNVDEYKHSPFVFE